MLSVVEIQIKALEIADKSNLVIVSRLLEWQSSRNELLDEGLLLLKKNAYDYLLYSTSWVGTDQYPMLKEMIAEAMDAEAVSMIAHGIENKLVEVDKKLQGDNYYSRKFSGIGARET